VTTGACSRPASTLHRHQAMGPTTYYQIWQHAATAERWLVRIELETLTGIYGPSPPARPPIPTPSRSKIIPTTSSGSSAPATTSAWFDVSRGCAAPPYDSRRLLR
jgi:hypothetical protein